MEFTPLSSILFLQPVSVSGGEFSMRGGSALSSGFSYDGEYNLNAQDDDFRNIGESSPIGKEFNSEYEGIVDLSFDFEGSDSINYDAIAAYNSRHPLFKTELDLLLEKI